MRPAFAYLLQAAVTVAAILAANYLVNNSRTVRRLVGPL